MKFYRGDIICMQGKMKIKNFDKIIDLIELYIELVEEIYKKDENKKLILKI